MGLPGANAGGRAPFRGGRGGADPAKPGRFVPGRTTVGDFVGRILPYHGHWHMGSIRATWEDLAAHSTSTTG